MQKLPILRQHVERLYGDHNPKADRWTDWAYTNHVVYVAKLTEKIAKQHGANVELAVAGALLHDCADAVTSRRDPDHEAKSLALAEDLLSKSGFNTKETDFIINEVIKPHGCNHVVPTTPEGKAMATADGAAHLFTDFYTLFCWRHYGPEDDYQVYKQWVRTKLEKVFYKKLFFDDIKEEARPYYEALKLVFR
jgi:putative nucleotidyltransferase with HDIG domain